MEESKIQTQQKLIRRLLISIIISIIALSLIIGSFFAKNEFNKNMLIVSGLGITTIQKAVDVIIDKKSRKLNLFILIALITFLIIFIVYKF